MKIVLRLKVRQQPSFPTCQFGTFIGQFGTCSDLTTATGNKKAPVQGLLEGLILNELQVLSDLIPGEPSRRLTSHSGLY
jgi:hypothetical protein